MQLGCDLALRSQKSAYKFFFLQSTYPSSWLDFFVRRVQLTFPSLSSICAGRIRSMLSFPFSQLKRLRPVLGAAWLCFAPNSLPTAARLHDGQDDRCPWCLQHSVLCSHILECDMFNTTISFMDLGPKWRSLQLYLDQTSATRLSGADAIALSLGLHLPSPLSPHHCRCCRPISLPCFPMTWFPSSLAFPLSAPSSKSARFFIFVCMHSPPCAGLSRMMNLHMYMHIHITLWHGRRQWVA